MISGLPPGRYLEKHNPTFTPDQQKAISEDMRRWVRVREVFLGRKGNLMAVREWISELPEGDYKEDMRRRMNVLRTRYRGCKEFGADRNQKKEQSK